MIRRRSYSIIYRVQRIILLVFFTISAIAISIPLARLVSTLSPDHLFPLVATLVLYMVAIVVIGSVIHVVSYIPFNLASAFDPIKNKVASGEINHMDQLGAEITAFTTGFFNFSFLDVDHAFIQTGSSQLISHQETGSIQQALNNYGMLEKSKNLEEIIRAGKFELNNKSYHLYVLPIWLGDRWLGYMGLLSRKRITRFFLKFLMEYENDFLDDQIMIVLQRQKKG